MKETIELYNLPLDDTYLKKINLFDCANTRVSNFLKNEALDMEENNMAKTRLFFNKAHTLVGFFTLFNDIFRRINKQKLRKEKWGLEVAEFYPAIRLHFMGVDKAYQRQGIGYQILMEVLDVCIEVSKKSGCTFLSIESFESSLEFYTSLGFRNMGKNGELYSVLFKIDELI